MITGWPSRDRRFFSVRRLVVRKCGEIAAGYQTVPNILPSNTPDVRHHLTINKSLKPKFEHQ
jgi:hypothetical protein